MNAYPLTAGALILALAVYVWSVMKVGRARKLYAVAVPAITGPEGFERTFRAQQNTVEQMVLFVPLLGLAAYVWNDLWAALFGLIWSVGRLLYIETYSSGRNRSAGFMLSGGLAMAVLIAVVVTVLLHHLGIA